MCFARDAEQQQQQQQQQQLPRKKMNKQMIETKYIEIFTFFHFNFDVFFLSCKKIFRGHSKNM